MSSGDKSSSYMPSMEELLVTCLTFCMLLLASRIFPLKPILGNELCSSSRRLLYISQSINQPWITKMLFLGTGEAIVRVDCSDGNVSV